MAGRGRGRGRGGATFNMEQITGIKNETKTPELIIHPPLTFPPLEAKPIPFYIEEDNEMSYMIELKREFTECTRESEFHINPVVVKKDIERYSDRYKELMGTKANYESIYNWSRFPNELRSIGVNKRKKVENKKPVLKKLKKNWENVVDRLQELEKKENATDSEVEKDEENEKEVVEEDEEKVEAEEEDVDEEMDEGTDYANNYFDNGEGYDDEDDNLDDEQTYS